MKRSSSIHHEEVKALVFPVEPVPAVSYLASETPGSPPVARNSSEKRVSERPNLTGKFERRRIKHKSSMISCLSSDDTSTLPVELTFELAESFPVGQGTMALQNLIQKHLGDDNIKYLGGGGFGRVFEVQYLKEPRALKRIASQQEEQQYVIARELILADLLRHRPGLVYGLKFWREPSTQPVDIPERLQDEMGKRRVNQEKERKERTSIFWLLMHRADADLDKLVRKHHNQPHPKPYQTLTVLQRLVWALQIAAAMCFLHRHRIIHRDLKPQNVLIFRSTQAIGDRSRIALNQSSVHVCDFGCSSFGPESLRRLKKLEIEEKKRASEIDRHLEDDLDDATETESQWNSGTRTWRIGTTGFQAPEIITKHNYDDPIDVYAFAMIMYSLFTGAFPLAVSMYDHLKPFTSKDEMVFDNDFINNTIAKYSSSTVKLQCGIDQQWTKPRKSFGIKIVKSAKGHPRPWFTAVHSEHIPMPLIRLIQSCWANSASLRPTFRKVYDQLLAIFVKSALDHVLELVHVDKFKLACEHLECIRAWQHDRSYEGVSTGQTCVVKCARNCMLVYMILQICKVVHNRQSDIVMGGLAKFDWERSISPPFSSETSHVRLRQLLGDVLELIRKGTGDVEQLSKLVDQMDKLTKMAHLRSILCSSPIVKLAKTKPGIMIKGKKLFSR